MTGGMKMANDPLGVGQTIADLTDMTAQRDAARAAYEMAKGEVTNLRHSVKRMEYDIGELEDIRTIFPDELNIRLRRDTDGDPVVEWTLKGPGGASKTFATSVRDEWLVDFLLDRDGPPISLHGDPPRGI